MNARKEYQSAIVCLQAAYKQMQSNQAKNATKQAYKHLKNLNDLLEHPEEQDEAGETTKKKSYFGLFKKNPQKEEGLVSIR